MIALGTVTTARHSSGCPGQLRRKNRLFRRGDRSLLTLGRHLALLRLTTITCTQDHPLPKHLSTYSFIRSIYFLGGRGNKTDPDLVQSSGPGRKQMWGSERDGGLLPSGVPRLEGQNQTQSPPARWGQGEAEAVRLPGGRGEKGSPPPGPPRLPAVIINVERMNE